MKIKVQYFASLRELLNLREEVLELQDDIDVAALFTFLAERHGQKLRAYVFDSAGAPKQHLQFLVDGKSITTLNGLKTTLHDGSAFAIIPPVGGG